MRIDAFSQWIIWSLCSSGGNAGSTKPMCRAARIVLPHLGACIHKYLSAEGPTDCLGSLVRALEAVGMQPHQATAELGDLHNIPPAPPFFPLMQHAPLFRTNWRHSSSAWPMVQPHPLCPHLWRAAQGLISCSPAAWSSWPGQGSWPSTHCFLEQCEACFFLEMETSQYLWLAKNNKKITIRYVCAACSFFPFYKATRDIKYRTSKDHMKRMSGSAKT